MNPAWLSLRAAATRSKSTGNLLKLVDKPLPSGTPYLSQGYIYDPADRIVGQLIEHGPSESPETAATMTYQADDRLDTFREGSGGSQPLTHDTDGNLTHAPALGTLSYNSRNQLIQHYSDTYQYDAAGRRVMTWRNGTAIRDLHDTRSPAYTLLARETWAPGGTFADFRYYVYTPNGQLLYEVRLNAASTETDMRWYHFDSRGNTLALSNANGQQTDTFTYTPYGQHTQLSGQWQPIFLYNGAHGIQTLPTGLLHMRNRDYSPQLKRFTTQDPIGFDGGWNLYAYAAGNPVVFFDPLGLEINVYTTNEAWGVGGFHHIYAHSTETGEAKGRSGSSGFESGNGRGAPLPSEMKDFVDSGAHTLVGSVVLPAGVTEQQFMDNLKKTAEDGIYIPWWNDCHTSVERAAENVGGRFEPNEDYQGRLGPPKETKPNSTSVKPDFSTAKPDLPSAQVPSTESTSRKKGVK